MEFIDVIQKRRTVRDFSQEEVAPEIIEFALEAGLKAPSYNHLKEWDFILVKAPATRVALTQTEKMIDQATEALQRSLEHYESLVQNMYLDALPKQKKMIFRLSNMSMIIFLRKKNIKRVHLRPVYATDLTEIQAE